MEAIKYIKSLYTPSKKIGKFKYGDNVSVHYRIIEGDKVRVQTFKGEVIKIQGQLHTKTFTVRKISEGLGVERTFPFYSPNIESVKINKVGKVKRAKLFYLRDRRGKSARIKERRVSLAELNKEQTDDIVKENVTDNSQVVQQDTQVQTSTTKEHLPKDKQEVTKEVNKEKNKETIVSKKDNKQEQSPSQNN